MRIGIFTDNYFPAVNGITYVVDETKAELEAMGHEVYVVAPSTIMNGDKVDRDPTILRVPAIKDLFFEDQFTSIFFPPQQLRRIKKLRLDVIMFTTPGQIGILGVYAALRHRTALISMYCTDLYECIKHYPLAKPAVLALLIASPVMLGVKTSEIRGIFSGSDKHEDSEMWSQWMIVEMVTIIHNRCAGIIAPSKKVKNQLEGWGTLAPIHVIPTGVKPLRASKYQIDDFKRKWGIKDTDKIILSIGRMGSEKNLELVIRAFDEVRQSVPDAKLLLVGDSEAHRKNLELLAAEQSSCDDIIFTGKVPREKIGAAYKAADVFVFPSLVDTQGLVLHEAADAGLPIVACDEMVSEVVKDGVNGLIADNSPTDFSDKVTRIMTDDKLKKSMSAASRELASHYSAHGQAEKMLAVFEQAAEQKIEN